MSNSKLAQMAREREADRAAGRPERGLFTGRGRSGAGGDVSSPRSKRLSPPDDDIEDDDFDDDELTDEDFNDDADDDVRSGFFSSSRRRVRDERGPRVGAKRSVLAAIRHIPAYLKLLFGLMRDGRVSRLDRFMVLAAVAYIVSPLDFVPDLIPFLGQVDDVFLVVMALQRLIDNAGRRVILDHWDGDPREVSEVNLTGLVSAAAFFLPSGIKRRLRRVSGRSKR
ncbi:MAG: DUF1232 domain-containing protein [Gemmatimonadaceae bacterium]|nr:DUF1232 domain-containing protein [Gemmatimonadaceae bacterium]